MTISNGGEGDLRAWFQQRMPERWTNHPPEITVDGDQVTVNVLLDAVDVPEKMPEKARKKTYSRQIASWGRKTRKKRQSISSEARSELGLNVVWGAAVEGHSRSFRGKGAGAAGGGRRRIRLPKSEATTVDSMVSSGAAKSRQEAVALCVRIAERHPEEWQGSHRAVEQPAESS